MGSAEGPGAYGQWGLEATDGKYSRDWGRSTGMIHAMLTAVFDLICYVGMREDWSRLRAGRYNWHINYTEGCIDTGLRQTSTSGILIKEFRMREQHIYGHTMACYPTLF